MTNANSLASIALYALSDLTNKNTVNVNILSTLEVSRIEYLLGKGSTFKEAKKQAQKEILNIFFIGKSDISESELLDISKNGDDNAILLALSVILQGYRTEAEMSQFLADISTDIKIDGVLNSSALGSELINSARLINLPEVRKNIENKFQSLGVSAVISDFEKYVKQFISSATYTYTGSIKYPESGHFGINILNNTSHQIVSIGESVSFCADLPKGSHLKVISNPNTSIVGYDMGIILNKWIFTGDNDKAVLESISSGLIDLRVHCVGQGSVTYDIYENHSLTPTRTKTIYIQ